MFIVNMIITTFSSLFLFHLADGDEQQSRSMSKSRSSDNENVSYHNISMNYLNNLFLQEGPSKLVSRFFKESSVAESRVTAANCPRCLFC